MLHYRLELPRYHILQELYLDYIAIQFKHMFVEQVQPIAKTEIVSLSIYTLVLGVLLGQVMAPHLYDRSQALHESVQVAIETGVSYPNQAFIQILQVLMNLLCVSCSFL